MHDHNDQHGHHHDHPDPGAFWRNLRKPMPLGQKIKLIFRNTWIKIRYRRACCSHPGEPGC